ncbi:PREDICTED: uncharacterized protein LOC106126959, partial [Papilio xuthus]|uniref:Uncharacterized protein LOC106126959 n=1 Tax=Papilio xuthus TaxID=66420 RepID=A0AAJ6ZW25_PAPXU
TLLRALAAALGALPAPQLAAAMRDAAEAQLRELRALMAADGEIKKGTRSDPVLWLDRLAALFRDVDVPPAAVTSQDAHPCLPALTDSWPVLYDVMKKWVSHSRVVERACRCLRFGVRCVGAGCAALLPALCTALPALYNAHPHGCVLYVCGVLCDVTAR